MADIRRQTRLRNSSSQIRRMSDRTATLLGTAVPTTTTTTASGHELVSTSALSDLAVNPLVAASQVISDIGYQRPLWNETWQNEAWAFYESLGEFNFGVEWFSEALSRVRLTAAKVTPGGDEPEILKTGAASELVTSFIGGIDGQSQMLRSMGLQLSVVGDAYFVGRDATQADVTYGLLMDSEVDEHGRIWSVHPANTLRRTRGRLTNFRRRSTVKYNWELQVDETVWIPLPEETLIVRVWDRNEHFPWRAMSASKAALPIMREIDMYNRHIIASLVSRISMNGMLLLPDEVTLPASPQYQNAVDPFIAEMLDIMQASIKNPGSPASAAPMPVRIPAEYIDKFKHLTFSTALDGKVFESRADAIRRLANTLNIPAEIVTGLGELNHWCVPQETKILTRTGWSSYQDLEIGTEVLTLNHDTGLSEWQPVLDVYKADVIDEPMTVINDSTCHESISTLNHRWPVVADDGEREWRTSETLVPSDRIVLAATHADIPMTAKYSDDFVRLIAWVIADGSVCHEQSTYNSAYQTVIRQSHRARPDNVIAIRKLLTNVYGTQSVYDSYDESCDDYAPRWREHAHKDSGMTTWILNRAAMDEIINVMSMQDKTVSHEFIYALTQSQLEIFVTTFAQGDCSVSKKHNLTVVDQCAEDYLDPVELAGILLGRVTHTTSCTSNGLTQDMTHHQHITDADSCHLCVNDRTSMTSYTGTIWCPVTPNSTWFARHNGKTFFTGNSSWQMSENAIKIHISPKIEIITRALTLGFLHPMLRAMGESTRTSDGSRIIMWYDTSELTQRPDRSGAAITLREMLVISDEAVRRETGFDEADAPTDEELEKMILMKLAVNPRTASAALAELTGLELTLPDTESPSHSSANENEITTDQQVLDTGQPVEQAPDTQNNAMPTPDEDVSGMTAAMSCPIAELSSLSLVDQRKLIANRVLSARTDNVRYAKLTGVDRGKH